MSDDRVLARIAAWQAAGLIDDETADRLREAEASAAPSTAPSTAPGRPVLASLTGGATAAELFALLGGGFALAAWYALVVSSPLAEGNDRSLVLGAAALVATVALVVVAAVIVGRFDRARRAAGVTLAVALGNLGVGVLLVLDHVRPEDWADVPTNALLAWGVTLAVAVVFRGWLPALTTQAGLAVAAAGTGWVAMGWLDAVLFPRGGGYEPAALEPGAALLRVVLTIGWWWLVAAGMAALLVLLDRAPAAEARHVLGRVAVGLTAIVGTTMGVLARHDWNAAGSLANRPILEPSLGAAVLLGVCAVLVGLAVRRVSTGYLWPAGLGVLIALTYLNAEYVVEETSLWVALLVEAVVLLGVAYGIRAVGGRIGRGDGGPAPLAPVPGP